MKYIAPYRAEKNIRFGTGRLPLLPWNVADPELSCDKQDAVSDLGPAPKYVSKMVCFNLFDEQ